MAAFSPEITLELVWDAIDIISFYWNGSNYFGTYSQNFG